MARTKWSKPLTLQELYEQHHPFHANAGQKGLDELDLAAASEGAAVKGHSKSHRARWARKPKNTLPRPKR